MITKGIIEKVDGYKALVRLPIYNNSAASKHSTKTEDLPKATFCSLPNIEIPFAKGDIVFVGFEDNDTNKPIILGHLYKAEGNPATPGLNLSTLKTSSSTKLSNNTWIGDVTPNELSALSGIKGNIQKQIDNLLSNTSASNNSSGDVDLSEIEESIQNEVSQRRLQDTQLNTRINDLQNLITNHNHDNLYSSISHNHDSNYLKLSGGNMTGLVSFNEGLGVELKTQSNSKYLIYGNGSANDALYVQIKDSNDSITGYYKLLDSNGILYNNNEQVSTISHNHDLVYAPLSHTHEYLPLTGGTISGNLTISGTITQQGSTYETHAEKVYSKKDYIYLREGQTGGLANGDYSGFEFVKYDGTNNGRLVVDNQGIARVGDVGSEQPLATREESPTNGGYAKWNSTTYRFETSTTDDDLVTRKTAQTITGQKTFTQELIKSQINGYWGYQIKNTGYKLGDANPSSNIGLGRFIVYGSDNNYISYVQTTVNSGENANKLQLKVDGSSSSNTTVTLVSNHSDSAKNYVATNRPLILQDKVELKYNNSTNSLEFNFL